MDDPGDLAQEGGKHLVHFHVADDGESRMIAIVGGLSDLGVDGIVVVHRDPGAERTVEVIEGDCVLRPDLGFKAVLGGLKKALDESSRGRVPGGSVTKPDVQPVAGGLETVGMIDLGVIEIELAWRPMLGQGARNSESMRISRLCRK